MATGCLGHGRYRLAGVFILCAVLSSFFLSCTTPRIDKLPEQKFLSQKNLTGISRVAVIVSTPGKDISLNQATGRDARTSLYVHSSILMAMDSAELEETERFRERLDFDNMRDLLAQSFIQRLRKAALFNNIVLLQNQDQARTELIGKYDAIIKLSLNTILLEKLNDGRMSLRIDIRGEMEKLERGETLWNRQEIIVSPNPRSLEEYKVTGQDLLSGMMETAGKLLSYDFVYLK